MQTAAALGITPGDFWDLTPLELRLYSDGVAQRQDREMQILAWMQANLINVHIAKGKRVSASDLYSPKQEPPTFQDAESFKAYMRTKGRR